MEKTWEKRTLGELATFYNGKAYKQEELLSEGKYKVLRVGNFFTKDDWYFSDLELEPEKYVEDGDLMYAWSASFGPRFWKGEKTIYHYHIWKVVPKPKVDKMFLYYILQHDVENLLKHKQGGTMFHITKGDIEKREIITPRYEDQIEIAKILTSCDEAIDKLSKLIVSKEKQKKGLMQNLLTGKVRFKKHSNTNWSYTKLGELSFIRRGASPRPISDPKFFSVEGRGWVRISDVSAEEGKYLNRTTQYLSIEGENNSVKVDKGDLIMSICATIGLPKIINIPSCIHDGFVLIKPVSGKLDTDFLYHYINFITDKLADGGQPGTQKNLNTDIVSRIQVPLIEIKEQKEVANVLDHAENEILILNKELIKLKKQKKGLMQQLLTGKIRVK